MQARHKSVQKLFKGDTALKTYLEGKLYAYICLSPIFDLLI